MDAATIAKRMEECYGFFCASCVHLDRARRAGKWDCGKDCGGPLSGKSFPHYEGPVTNKAAFCFVSGDPSTGAIDPGDGVLIGITEKAMWIVNNLSLPGKPSLRIRNVDIGIRR